LGASGSSKKLPLPLFFYNIFNDKLIEDLLKLRYFLLFELMDTILC